MYLRFATIVFSILVTFSSQLRASSLEGQHSLIITAQNIQEFRQISLLILAAYKNQPQYVGSTEKWHLFLKKETSVSESRSYSSVFGYKIPVSRTTPANGWLLEIPSPQIDPAKCPVVTNINKNKTDFGLPEGDFTRYTCIGS